MQRINLEFKKIFTSKTSAGSYLERKNMKHLFRCQITWSQKQLKKLPKGKIAKNLGGIGNDGK